MKKKFVLFLCRIGLYRIAYKISPSIAGYWKVQKVFENVGKGFEEATKNIRAPQKSLENLTSEIKEKSNKAMKIKLDDGAIMPTRAHATDVGGFGSTGK